MGTRQVNKSISMQIPRKMHVHHLLLICLFSHAALAKERDVVVLNDENFSEKISKNDVTLVAFYAPWCSHCQNLKPRFEVAAEELLNHQPPIILAKIDCTLNGEKTCKKYGISGYPTMKIFRHGVFYQTYGGPRDSVGIVEYMKEHTKPISKEISSVANFEALLKDRRDVVVAGFFEDESALQEAFLKAAVKLKNTVKFVLASSKPMLDHYGINNGIVLFRPRYLLNSIEPSSVTYAGPPDPPEIGAFIEKHRFGLVGHRRPDNKEKFRKPLIVAYFNIDYGKNPKGTGYWRNRILKVAREFQNRVNFAISDKDDFKDELADYGIPKNSGDKPVIFARNIKNEKFFMSTEFSTNNFHEFVQNFMEGKLELYVKSEPIPPSNDQPVKMVVAKNFDQLINESGRDGFIKFDAPWCGHCIKFAPIFNQLALKLQDEEVDFFKMNVGANDVPKEYKISGLPTLYWLPKHQKNHPVVYDGSLDLNDLIRYVAKHATHELKGYNREGLMKKLKTEL